MTAIRNLTAVQSAASDRRTEAAKAALISADDEKELREAARGFESILLGFLIKSMRGTVPESEFLPKGFGGKIWEQMFDERMSQQFSESGKGLGLADAMLRDLTNQRKGRAAYGASLIEAQ